MRIRYTDRLTNEEYYVAAARATSGRTYSLNAGAPPAEISHAMDTARKANKRPPNKHVAFMNNLKVMNISRQECEEIA
ncbi:unnamed protein product [Heligmosomoides polygyrus]|uniref:DUF1508 domain-containing protein n=1 Tax=Heligmosomoides polygyrus TaxID=6339 RepID=A0A183FQJ1_HELPZ|nr:unnamed protein product [Heligmosomoides polygyrus]